MSEDNSKSVSVNRHKSRRWLPDNRNSYDGKEWDDDSDEYSDDYESIPAVPAVPQLSDLTTANEPAYSGEDSGDPESRPISRVTSASPISRVTSSSSVAGIAGNGITRTLELGSRRRDAEEQERQRLAQEDLERQRKDEEERLLQAEDERQRQLHAEAARAAEEERKRLAEEERRKAAEEERRKAAEEERRKTAEKEKLKAAEEERLRAAEEERLKAAEEERLRAAEEERLRAAEEERLRAAEEERLRAAEEERLRAAEEERLRAAEEERLRAAEEERLRAAEEERLRAAEEERLRAAEEERLRAAEEERIRAAEHARVQAAEDERARAEAERVRLLQIEKAREVESQKHNEEKSQGKEQENTHIFENERLAQEADDKDFHQLNDHQSKHNFDGQNNSEDSGSPLFSESESEKEVPTDNDGEFYSSAPANRSENEVANAQLLHVANRPVSPAPFGAVAPLSPGRRVSADRSAPSSSAKYASGGLTGIAAFDEILDSTNSLLAHPTNSQPIDDIISSMRDRDPHYDPKSSHLLTPSADSNRAGSTANSGGASGDEDYYSEVYGYYGADDNNSGKGPYASTDNITATDSTASLSTGQRSPMSDKRLSNLSNRDSLTGEDRRVSGGRWRPQEQFSRNEVDGKTSTSSQGSVDTTVGHDDNADANVSFDRYEDEDEAQKDFEDTDRNEFERQTELEKGIMNTFTEESADGGDYKPDDDLAELYAYSNDYLNRPVSTYNYAQTRPLSTVGSSSHESNDGALASDDENASDNLQAVDSHDKEDLVSNLPFTNTEHVKTPLGELPGEDSEEIVGTKSDSGAAAGAEGYFTAGEAMAAAFVSAAAAGGAGIVAGHHSSENKLKEDSDDDFADADAADENQVRELSDGAKAFIPTEIDSDLEEDGDISSLAAKLPDIPEPEPDSKSIARTTTKTFELVKPTNPATNPSITVTSEESDGTAAGASSTATSVSRPRATSASSAIASPLGAAQGQNPKGTVDTSIDAAPIGNRKNLGQRLNRPPVFDFMGVITKGTSKTRTDTFFEAAQKEAAFDTGLVTWLELATSARLAEGNSPANVGGGALYLNGKPPESDLSKLPTRTSTTISLMRPARAKSTQVIGKVGEKSSKTAKGLFSRTKKLLSNQNEGAQ